MRRDPTKKGLQLYAALSRSFTTNDYGILLLSKLCSQATTYHRIQEDICNGPPGVEHMDPKTIERWQERTAKRDTRQEELIWITLAKINDLVGIEMLPKFGGDPRGATLKLIMPDGRYDDWGKEGICVPTQ